MTKLPKAPTGDERKAMANAWFESPEFKDTELDKNLLTLIRNGHAIFIHPDLFQITEEGSDYLKCEDA